MTLTDHNMTHAGDAPSHERASRALAAPDSRALVIDGDARSASHFKETLDRIGIETAIARSIAEGVALAAQPRLNSSC
jgi:ActR/RegA family two-component response regulator